MKKLLWLLFEECLFIGSVLLIASKFSNHLPDFKTSYLLCLVIGLSILASNGIDVLIGKRIHLFCNRPGKIQQAKEAVISSLLVSIIFGCAYTALTYLARFSVCFRTLFLVSLLSALAHILFGALTSSDDQTGDLYTDEQKETSKYANEDN